MAGDSFRKHAERERFGLSHGLGFASSIFHCTWKLQHLGDPAPVFFLCRFNGE